MAKGLAIIIPNADFSKSPLGQVTFVKSISERADEAVSAYATVIDSHTHDKELKTLIMGLMVAGVWDSIGVFPMLGDTMAKRMTPLNVDKDASITDLYYPETAIIDAEKGEVKFTNSILNPTFSGTLKSYSVVGAMKAFAFADFQRASVSPNGSGLTAGDCLKLGTGALGNGVQARPRVTIPSALITGDSTLYVNQIGTTRLSLGAYIGNSNILLYKDGTLHSSEAVNSVTDSYVARNILGSAKSIGDTEIALFDGWCSFYAYGQIEDESKVASVISALQIFLDSVKPNNK